MNIINADHYLIWQLYQANSSEGIPEQNPVDKFWYDFVADVLT